MAVSVSLAAGIDLAGASRGAQGDYRAHKDPHEDPSRRQKGISGTPIDSRLQARPWNAHPPNRNRQRNKLVQCRSLDRRNSLYMYLDGEQMLKATAQDLDERRQNLTLFTVGGAINTVYLRSRQTTHDVDFFGTHLNQRQLQMIDEAMQYAERMSSVPLGGAWLNNETQLHMAPDSRRYITDHALEQNMVVFKEPGLTVVAAPWSYSFISKSQRLGSQYERPYDLDDAVAYLAEWNRRAGNEVATAGKIQNLCARYRQPMIADPTLRRVNERYRARHRRDGIRK